VDTPTEDLLRARFVINLGGFVVTSTINGGLKGSAGEVFTLSYQDINGNWTDLATHVDVSKGSFNGRLNTGYQGPLTYLKGGF
jgi:hypothetical protein